MVTIDLDTSDLRAAMNVVHEFCQENLAGNSDMEFKVKLIFEEIMSNFFKYALPGGTERVAAHLETRGEEVLLTFVYRGDDFDPTSYRDARIDEPFSEKKQEGGLGLFLVHQFAKAFFLEKNGDKNILYVRI